MLTNKQFLILAGFILWGVNFWNGVLKTMQELEGTEMIM